MAIDPESTLARLERAALGKWQALEDEEQEAVRYGGTFDEHPARAAYYRERIERTEWAFACAGTVHAEAPEEERLAGLLAQARREERERCAELVMKWAEWYHEQMEVFEKLPRHHEMVLVNDRYCTNCLHLARMIREGKEPTDA